ncbi:hypothetical protein ACS0TY_010144 [Phlomoides rotata]
MEIKDDVGVETIFSSSTSPEVYVSRQTRNQRNYNPDSNLFQGVPPSIPFFTGSFVDLMHSFNGVNQPSKNHVGDFEDINPPSIPTESSSDDDTGREIDDLSDDASSFSGDDGSFENPNDIPHAHIPVENTFKSSRLWHIPGSSSYVPPPSVDDSYVNECPGVLSDDSTFISKHEMQTSVGYYHLLNRVEYRVKRSNARRWYLKCKFEDCEFMFHALGSHDLWRTSKFPHTCRVDPDRSAPRSLPSKVIGSYYAANQLDKSTASSPIKLQAHLKREHGLGLLYNQTLRARNFANELVYGNHEESFKMLPSYLYQLETANPTSKTSLLVENKKFKYGTHLKGKFKGVVFVAITQDCNHQNFPLATGIGHLENNESWTWFLERLREAFGCPKNLLIVSDQHKSIIHAMSMVYPDAAHGLCYFHLQKKLVVYGRNMVKFFKRAAYSYRASEYNRILDKIKQVDSRKILETLKKVKPERWS